ncbi:MAG: hypothetical protein PWQ29_271 [Verrucomicrobiota bacterium]|jgi:hypothetical protein|nr:hypothetical protein [Verrucomicrobiota bacterium]MDK2962877.1 hypothetical protein [Verrucomicrobiota bacterium]
MREYKWTLIGLILAMGLWVLSVRFHLDLFEAFISYLRHHEYAEIDKFIPPILLFCIFATIDLACRHQKIRIEIEKLKVYRSMLKAMNHILNNFLHKMLLFKLTAEETEGFDPEVLKQYDTIIAEASAQINALEAIEKPAEETILRTVEPKSGNS